MKEEFDKNIFKEMILFISARCKDKPNFSLVHLNRILFYTDFFWYGHTSKSISGETYCRGAQAQIPTHIDEARDELRGEGFLEIVTKRCVDTVQKRPVVKTGIEFVKLSKDHQEFIDTIIAWIVDHNTPERNGKDAVDELPWQSVEIGEEIPYEIVFFRKKNSLSHKDIEEAQVFIDKYERRLKANKHAVV